MSSDLPMNRWHAGRMIFAANMFQFMDAVANLKYDIEEMTGLKVSLAIAFYKAADGQDQDKQPVQMLKEITSLKEMLLRDWNKAAYVEARLTPLHEEEMMPPPYHSVTVSAKWPDDRRITFHVDTDDPRDTRGDLYILRNRVLDKFLLWERGLDFKR